MDLRGINLKISLVTFAQVTTAFASGGPHVPRPGRPPSRVPAPYPPCGRPRVRNDHTRFGASDQRARRHARPAEPRVAFGVRRCARHRLAHCMLRLRLSFR